MAGDDDDDDDQDDDDDEDDDDGSHQQRHPQTSAAASRLFGWSTGCYPLFLLPRPGLKSNPRPAEPQLRLGLQFQFFFIYFPSFLNETKANVNFSTLPFGLFKNLNLSSGRHSRR